MVENSLAALFLDGQYACPAVQPSRDPVGLLVSFIKLFLPELPTVDLVVATKNPDKFAFMS